MAKVLVINASPRRSGIMAQMAAAAADSAAGEGAEVETIALYDEKFAPCTGCCRCRTGGDCVLPRDSAHRIGAKIADADLLVVATPTWWGGMNSLLKMLFDRLVYIFAELPPRSFPKPLMKGRRAIVVAACSTPYPFNVICGQSSGAVKAVKEVLGTAGYSVRSIQIGGTCGMDRVPQRFADRMRRMVVRSLGKMKSKK